MPSIREGARRLRSGRRCGIELLEDRRLLTVALTSTDYVVPAGSQAAVIQVRYMPLGPTFDPKAEDHVELALYAEGADPAVDAPLARVPVVLSLGGQSSTVPLPASS